jgi:hypothetical protein
VVRIALLTLIAIAAIPAAADERVWHVSGRAQLPIADYGVPETDDRLMSVHCDLDGTVLIDPQLYRGEPAEGTSLVVTVDGTEYAEPARFIEDLANAAWKAVASVPPQAPVIDALRRGAEARVALRPESPADLGPRTVSLTGSARAIAEALAPCR